MAAILQSVPQGLPEAVADSSKLPKHMLAQICQDVATFLQYKSGPVQTDKYAQQLEALSTASTKVSVKSIINAITFLYRSAAELKLDSNDFRSQLSSTDIFTESVVETLVHLWDLQGQQLIATTSQLQALNVGQLLDVQWRVGVAMSSDDCKNLHSPNVTLLLTVGGMDGTTSKHSLEMTLTQFRNFSSQLKEMAMLMETV